MNINICPDGEWFGCESCAGENGDLFMDNCCSCGAEYCGNCEDDFYCECCDEYCCLQCYIKEEEICFKCSERKKGKDPSNEEICKIVHWHG